MYVEPGMCNTANKVYTSLEKYKMSIDTNLEQIGCKTDGEDLEDFFDSAIGVGLIPMLCGYGARKMAMGLVAARYGEIPTIISIPAGYKDIDTLNDKINNAETEVIVVEDLFGKMNEEIILPILRRDIDKQLLFCCESLECMKYVAKYFYNYILHLFPTLHIKFCLLVFLYFHILLPNLMLFLLLLDILPVLNL